MLQTLDTLIAFVVIMTVVSLLITLLVQMVSAALSLRGKNLANALAVTFQTIDPGLKEQAHALAEHILKDPILSDSLHRDKDRGAIALRSAPAQWAVFKDQGHAWQLATAVRPGEVYRILHDLAGATPAAGATRAPAGSQAAVANVAQATPELADSAAKLLKALGASDATTQEAAAKVQAVQNLVDPFTTPEVKQAIIESLGNFGATVDKAVTGEYDRFQRWFGSAQDRAEQWFQVHARVVTIVFSFLLAFLFQLDTVEIFHRLSLDQKKLVPEIVKLGPTIQKQGEAILKVVPPDAKTTTGSQPDVTDLKDSYEKLIGTIQASGFDIVPTPFLGRWDLDRESRPFGRFLGMIITAGLLTLGAPFWFNLLKNLMNLRPAVATLIERRPQSGPALPQSPDKPNPAQS